MTPPFFPTMNPGLPSPETGLVLESYLDQTRDWPQSGRHILAQFDTDSIVVYQAYRASIARFAVDHQHFGGEFSLSRMSWIKPNFLWMMYRSGWATKEGQEHVLAIRIRRAFFDEILSAAVASTFSVERYPTHAQWQAAPADSDVRLQLDPDHTPSGAPTPRRAIQLGLRGGMLRRYATAEILSITDITPFVIGQRSHADRSHAELMMPAERSYQPASGTAATAINLDPEAQ